MCGLFLVLSQLQFMPKQEYRLSRKKTENQFLTIREVPVKGWTSLSTRPELWCPHTQGTVWSSEFEVVVGAQERQIVPNAQLSE